MFTITSIQEAIRKVKSGADYPKLVKDLKSMGVVKYEHLVTDGSTIYYGENKHSIRIGHEQKPISINAISSAEKLKDALKIHQAGQTDYPTFCSQAGEAGVEKWVSNLIEMTVTYLDKAGLELLVERIPL